MHTVGSIITLRLMRPCQAIAMLLYGIFVFVFMLDRCGIGTAFGQAQFVLVFDHGKQCQLTATRFLQHNFQIGPLQTPKHKIKIRNRITLLFELAANVEQHLPVPDSNSN